MKKPKRHYYLIDDLSAARAQTIEQGLKAVESIESVRVDLGQRLLEVVCARNPDDHVDLACTMAGAVVRTKVKKGQL